MGIREKRWLPVAGLCVAWVVICWGLPVGAEDAPAAPPGGQAAQEAKPVPLATPTVTTAETRGAGSAADRAASQAKAPESAYRIQPGDTITVTVLGVAECSGAYVVRPDGTVLLQDEMVGTIPVGGCTENEAAAAVTARIGEYVKEPSVLLTISRFKVAVVGEVRQPGQYELGSGARLMEAVERAGGVKDEKKDLGRVYLTKASGQEERFNLRDFREKGDTSQNPLVEPGDRISVGKTVGSKEGEYKVSGAVAKPGTYQLDESEETRVSDAVKEAGRWTQDANPKAAQLLRKDGTKRTIDLTRLDADPAGDDNALLQEGDQLFVPRNTTVVNVLGGVKKPGQYNVPPGTTLLEAISLAGGLEENAILKECAVVRSGPKPVRIAANLERLTKQGDMTQNPVMEDRDVVFVPVRPAPKEGGKNALATIAENAWRYMWMWRYVW